MDFKRPAPSSRMIVPDKRARVDYNSEALSLLSTQSTNQNKVSSGGGTAPRPRTSNLHAPIMLLSGQEGEIYCGKFSPDGSYFASAGFDRSIFLWDTYGECENFAVLTGHGGAILNLCFSTDGDLMYTASTDKTIALWDMETGERVRRFKGHQGFVNCCHVARRGPQLVCSGSDDGTVRLFDRRQKTPAVKFENTYQVLSVSFNDNNEQIFSGGIDNVIKVWDIRKTEVIQKFLGHQDSVTGLSLSPDGHFLLSNSMDSTLRIWDVRPYASDDRCMKILQGHSSCFEKNLLRCAWSPDNKRVTCGSGDNYVYVWDVVTRQILYKLSGHSSSVNETAFHPEEPIIASVSSDRKIYLGEIAAYN